MDKILVNSEELKGISVKINSIISSIEGIEKTLDVLTTESESSWQGKAKEEAEKNFKKIKEKSGTLREQLTKFVHPTKKRSNKFYQEYSHCLLKIFFDD